MELRLQEGEEEEVVEVGVVRLIDQQLLLRRWFYRGEQRRSEELLQPRGGLHAEMYPLCVTSWL
jgi:hypothetical protein